jgi:hypothetical protein
MPIEAITPEQLDEIRAKIEKARQWARNHFNAGRCSDTRMFDENLVPLPPSFFVDFPAPDRMRITPSILGKPSNLWIEYRLHFHKDGSMTWQGKHPVWDTPLPPLVIPKESWNGNRHIQN